MHSESDPEPCGSPSSHPVIFLYASRTSLPGPGVFPLPARLLPAPTHTGSFSSLGVGDSGGMFPQACQGGLYALKAVTQTRELTSAGEAGGP